MRWIHSVFPVHCHENHLNYRKTKEIQKQKYDNNKNKEKMVTTQKIFEQ